MHKKVVLSLLGVFAALLVVVVGFILETKMFAAKPKQTVVKVQISPSPTTMPYTEKKSIFVPYWNCNKGQVTDVNNYDRMIYFGLEAVPDGINNFENGYKKIESCLTNFISVKDKYIVVRMLDSDTNFAILKSTVAQKKIIQEAIEISKQYGFKGIVLDLEFGSYFFSSTADRVNEFVQDFHSGTNQEGLKFAMLLYGDTFYRNRPFPIKQMEPNADEFIIMAYDFHKAGGEPGPNFPLYGSDKWGYDFQTMIRDFVTIIPAKKLTVAFGMYGYDWIVDPDKKPIKPAKSISYNDIKSNFLDKCQWKNCIVKRDDQSAETEVEYVDQSSVYHILWFEDLESVDKKREYLRGLKIGSAVYWTYGYY